LIASFGSSVNVLVSYGGGSKLVVAVVGLIRRIVDNSVDFGVGFYSSVRYIDSAYNCLNFGVGFCNSILIVDSARISLDFGVGFCNLV